jgi:hypothetical protein
MTVTNDVISYNNTEPVAKRTRYAQRHRPMEAELVQTLEILTKQGILGPQKLGRLSCVSRTLSAKCNEEIALGNVMHNQWPPLKRTLPSLERVPAPPSQKWLFHQCASRLLHPPPAKTDAQQDNKTSQCPMDLSNLDDCVVLVSVHDETVRQQAIVSQAFTGTPDLQECMTSTGKFYCSFPHLIPLEKMQV